MAEYINREAAIRALLNDAPEQVSYSREDAADCIRYMPAADVAPVVHGRWIGATLCGNDNCKCSECGSWHNIHVNLRGKIMQKYCPNCGARMDGGKNDAVD